MENKTMSKLHNLKIYDGDSQFMKLVIKFLENQINDLADFAKVNHSVVFTKINIILQQLEITRLSKDDSALRNACINVAKDPEEMLRRYRNFKHGIADIIHSDMPLSLSDNQASINRLSREKLNLLEGLTDAENTVLLLTTDNAKLKSKVLILEEDIPVMKKATEFEEKFNGELNLENKKLRRELENSKTRIAELEALLKYHRTTPNLEACASDFVQRFNKSMQRVNNRSFTPK